MAALDQLHQLHVVIDPVARYTDGESVRIAKDVLSAGAMTRVCLPDGPEEFDRALAKGPSRRLVLIGDDRSLLRAVTVLHRRRELAGRCLSVVPVGPMTALARSLGVPAGAVAASRAVLDGRPRRLDLLVDDSGGVVLGTLRIPPGGYGVGAGGDEAAGDVGDVGGSGGASGLGDVSGSGDVGGLGGAGRSGGAGGSGGAGAFGGSGGPGKGGGGLGTGGTGGTDGTDGTYGTDGAVRAARSAPLSWLRTCRSLVRTLGAVSPWRLPGLPGAPQGGARGRSHGAAGRLRLRVEADGVTLVDLDQPLYAVSVSVSVTVPGAGTAEVEIRPLSVGAGAAPVLAGARTVTVSGEDFRYRADAVIGGPVRTRTWTVREGAWSLTLPG